MPEYPHLLYSKSPEKTNGFKRTRGRDTKKEEQKPEPAPPISEEKKRFLAAKLNAYNSAVAERVTKKTLPIPAHIDLIQIDFYVTFDKELQNHFFRNYGLYPIDLSHFNKNVLFSIGNKKLFKNFFTDIDIISKLKQGEDHRKESFSRLALISDFFLLDDTHRKGVLSGQEGYVLTICDILEYAEAREQLNYLTDYLKSEGVEVTSTQEANLFFLKNGFSGLDKILAENFDIIRLITSARVPVIKPGTVATPVRSYGFKVSVEEDLPIVCVVDTGIQAQVEPLTELMTNITIDHTGTAALWDEVGHGTAVAGLIAFGTDFYDYSIEEIPAKARLAVLKVIHEQNDDLNVVALIRDIRELYLSYDIRIFNISLNLPGSKPYNGAIGKFAFELDKLAYELDILVINSIGNYKIEDIDTMLLLGDLDINTHYPSFFYKTNPEIEGHSCDFTNLQEPSESMNNLSVGALAGNFETEITDGITPAKEYPAIYSRKSHWDATALINGKKLKDTQRNKYLFKPDLVFEGGDYVSLEAGMEVLSSPQGRSPYFARMAGTSLATPLITSMVAQLVKEYPALKMTSIKALLINSAESPAGKKPPHFNSADTKKLFHKLTGHGRPNPDRFMESNEDSITFVIEDSIKFDGFYSFDLRFPDWVLSTSNKIELTATLVYKFLPIPNNHLAYLPLHISFGIFKPREISTLSQDELKNYILKKGESWSEDHFGVEDRVFSNVQKVCFSISPHHFDADNPCVAIAMRCYGKSTIPQADFRHLRESAHPFSLVVGLREIPRTKKSKLSGSLYNDIEALNELQAIADLEAGSSVEGGI
ncbi:S8 family peptidase [Algoriphagus sp. D3-2-R+10]|uniref:S8 family peptidase n=1 Tax=Algoriphagus aurantiacus TaxID=3103948 RepID=UPI002B38B9BC|nr:S8 family peptidase [Algoriphagus sp. D3-2-R+10]MEB2773671.1 S8 family peptidase [Algoriphagus sp. D3-2-R+10]